MKHGRITSGLVMICIATVIAVSSCSAEKDEGFAIYLTKDNISPDKMEDLSHIELSAEPLMTSKDLVSYEAVNQLR